MAPKVKKSCIINDSSDDEYKVSKTQQISNRKASDYNLFIGEKMKMIAQENKDICTKDRMKMAIQLWREQKLK
jgi:hypothetical protein